MYDLIIKNGTIVTAWESYRGDIAIQNGKIAAIGDAACFSAAKKVLDAENMYVLPGAIDGHAHIASANGGTVSLDDYHNGTVAAAYGGATTILDFGFLKDRESPRQALDRKLKEAAGQCVTNYSFHPCITHADPVSLAEIRDCIREGFAPVKMFTVYRNSLMIGRSDLYRVLSLVAEENSVALVHCEDADLIESSIQRCIDSGRTSPADHMRSRPLISETIAMEGVASMAADVGASVIFAHMTTGSCPDLLKRPGIFAEVCPHYLTLTPDVYEGELGCRFICSPPMRSIPEQEKLWSLVQQGLVSVISSDHTDYSIAQKEAHKDYFPLVPNGLPTIETRGTVFYSEGVAKGRISINDYVRLTATNPAKLNGLYPQKGSIRIGADADLVVLDPAKKWVNHASQLHMQTDYSPYEGLAQQGQVVHTIVNGHCVIENSAYQNDGFLGSLVKCGTPVTDLGREVRR